MRQPPASGVGRGKAGRTPVSGGALTPVMGHVLAVHQAVDGYAKRETSETTSALPQRAANPSRRCALLETANGGLLVLLAGFAVIDDQFAEAVLSYQCLHVR